MKTSELIVRQLAFSRDTVLMTIEDYSEAELLVRLVPAANHRYWQLGHLCDIEVDIVNSIRARTLVELPDDFHERYYPLRLTSFPLQSRISTEVLR